MGNYNWADAYNTNGYNGWWSNPGVRTEAIPMPLFRTGYGGAQAWWLAQVYYDWAAGPASIWAGIYYGGYDGSGGLRIVGHGGVFAFWIRGSAGTLQFGRDPGAGRTVQSENEAFSWAGTLAGSFDYYEFASQPTFGVTQNGRNFTFWGTGSADNGGATITAYYRRMRVNGGPWTAQTSNWSAPFEGIPGNTYQFELWAENIVGSSVANTSPVYTVPYSGGRRATGSNTSTPLTISRRFNGSNWVDLTTKRRYTGSNWAEITN